MTRSIERQVSQLHIRSIALNGYAELAHVRVVAVAQLTLGLE